MPFTRSWKHYSLPAKRVCKKCADITDQQGVSCRYSAPTEPKVPPVYVKRLEWVCVTCGNVEVEEKEVLQPSEKAMIFNRLLRIPEDYDILGFSISSEPDGISFKVRLPNYDMGEIRAIQTKAEKTDFITVGELMQLQKAGFNRPGEVPPKPTPKDSRTLREKSRQRAFEGEPRSI